MQRGFRKGRCVDQIFSLKIIIGKNDGQREEVCCIHTGLEKLYDRINRKALWDVLKVYGAGVKLLNGVQAFCKEAKTCIRVKGELSDSFGIQGVRRTGMCDVLIWLFNIDMMKVQAGEVGVKNMCT